MSRPAPVAAATGALVGNELRMTARRGENVLVTIVIPAVVLLFFASLGLLPIAGRPVDFLLPGSIALAVIATSLVNLGIATAYERAYGVLKRLGGAPIPRWSVVAAKIAAVLVVEAIQVALLVAIAVAVLGWQVPAGASPLLAVVAVLLGTAAFAGLGLAMAGGLRAEATLAGANGLFVAFLLLGGIVLPIDHLPPALATVAAALPADALAETLRAAFGSSTGDVTGPFALLTLWAVGGVALAIRAFRWE